MSLEAWYTIGVIVLVIASLMTNRLGADTAMAGGLTLMLVGDWILPGNVLSVGNAIGGFSNQAIMMIGALFVVAAGLKETGGMEFVAHKLLGRPKTVAGAQARMMAPVAVMSGFMNNTPIVAMYLPIINDWAKRLGMSPSKLYMPLSYAAILGGKLTYIGSGSNIVVMALYLDYLANGGAWVRAMGVEPLSESMTFWGIAWLGVPTAIVGIIFIIAFSRWLLPARRAATSSGPDARRYQVEMSIQADSPIVGQTIEDAGLRSLPGLYLAEIEREGDIMPAPPPEERLQANDRLAFVGVLESVMDLRKIRGLAAAGDQVEKIRGDHRTRTLVEAVVSNTSPLVGRTVRSSRFRTTYNAAIIAVHRGGQQINQKIGDIVLQAGDTLLLETHTGFVRAQRNSGHFFLVSAVEDSRPIRHERAGLALAILALMIVLFTVTTMEKVAAAFLCAMLMIVTRCVTGTEARRAVNWQVLLVIGSALGLGTALRETGAAEHIATAILSRCGGFGDLGMLFVIYLLGALFAQLVTNNGAAILMFPIAMMTAEKIGASPLPFVFTLMIAAGSPFISPVGYQTNLMVYGPGSYRFFDFVRFGTPLTVVVGVVTVLIAPLVFPFHP